ncbi:hypothetical protein [Sphaerisporangium perillae]|uniref:hypothetical protein n=1 Tax=Sphaerisporangium perillae TaxID=2935860 RepID=UPI00200BD880|nr:hypothetical protein [Sphaerisporangium perillae]
MRFLAAPYHLPPRIATGVYIFNSGLSKTNADEQTATGLHGMAAGAYPFLKKIDPVVFTRLLSTAELALGTALLVPVIPSALAGLGLTAFGAGLIGLYLRTPGLRQPGSIRPTQEGVGIAKDSWLVGIGLGLIMDECLHKAH